MAIKRSTKNVQMYITTRVIVSSDLCACSVQQVTMSHQSYL